MTLPGDWRERMIAMIRGATELDGSWFTGGPVCSPEEQIGIYRTQYRLRLYDAVEVEIPGLTHLLGDAAEPLLVRYLFDNPSNAWTLNRVADRLADWLAAQPEATVAHVEMARFDWAIQHGFEAVDSDPLDPSALGQLPQLALQPHVHLLRVTHNVHEIRSAVVTGQPVPELRTGDFPLVVFRAGLQMRHWCVPLGLWGILEAIGRGQTLPEAIDTVFVEGWVTLDELSEHIGAWCRDLALLKLVQVA
jgi:Putative DNA-binding domain